MSESDKERMADALAAMSGGSDPVDAAAAAQIAAAAPAAQRPVAAVADDDAVIAPPPDPTVFAPRHRASDLAFQQSLRNKRTIIPILLTCGVMLPLIGSLKWLAGEDSIYAAWDNWVPLLLALAGLILLSLAVLNMLQVRHLLRQRHAV